MLTLTTLTLPIIWTQNLQTESPYLKYHYVNFRLLSFSSQRTKNGNKVAVKFIINIFIQQISFLVFHLEQI